jgi:hypothetical protein
MMHVVLIAMLAVLLMSPVSEGAVVFGIRIGDITIGSSHPSESGGLQPEPCCIKPAFENARNVCVEPISEASLEARSD